MGSQFAEFQPNVEQLGTAKDYVNEFVEAVHNGELLQGFTRQETILLSEYFQCFGVPRGSVVVREGDEGDFLAILINGAAMVTKLHGTVQKEVAAIQPGDIIGEMSLIDGKKRFASCITTVPSDFGVLTIDSFNAMLADHPRLSNKLMLRLLQMTTARLRYATTRMLPGLSDVRYS